MSRDTAEVIAGRDAFTAWFPVKPGTKEAAVAWAAYQRRRPSPEEQARWQRRFPNSNRAIATGRPTGVVVVDVDPRNGGDRSLSGKAMLRTFMVSTPSGGTHYYFKYRADVPTCVPMLPGVEVRSDGVIVLIPPSVFGGKPYEVVVDEPLAELPAWIVAAAQASEADEHREPIDTAAVLQGVPEGQRDKTLFRFACKLRHADLPRDFAERLVLEAAANCTPPFPPDEARAKAASAYQRYAPGRTWPLADPDLVRPRPPDSLASEAFHGVAGDLTNVIARQSEADPVAILAQILVITGSIMGHSPHAMVENTRHGLNEFVVTVGRSGHGRKGTAYDRAVHPFRTVDPDFFDGCVQGGVSTGEGLIAAVRDPIERQDPVKVKGHVTGYTTVIADHGVPDKRLLVVETELGRTLRVMDRDGNTLSETLRQAWDSAGRLRVMTRQNPLRATDAHISIIGHITHDDLRRRLTETDAANGFGNRFIWLCTRRMQMLPDGGSLSDVELAPFVERLRQAVTFARNVGLICRDDAARDLWHHAYPRLSVDRPGLFGAITSRAEAHVLRLSLLYALLDLSATVSLEHLEAALTLWAYADASARFLFGAALGDPVADEILRALRNAPDGLTRWDINNLFKRNRKAEELDRALGALLEHGLAVADLVETGGRRAQRWRAASMEDE